VSDALSVSGAQGIGQRGYQVEEAIEGQAVFRDDVIQVFSRNQFHG
jgi:hypothetical protein